jgi:recombinational DNA repair protein RecT
MSKELQEKKISREEMIAKKIEADLTNIEGDFLAYGLKKEKLQSFKKYAIIQFKTKFFDIKEVAEENRKRFDEYCECLKIMARLNLLPDGLSDKAYLIGYKSKAGFKIQLQIGWKGYMEVANKNGWNFTVNTIFENDIIDLDIANNIVIHKPDLKNRGDAIAWYCLAKKNNITALEFMSKNEIEEIRRLSKNSSKNNKYYDKDKDIWEQHFNEMAKKTVMKRCIKRLDITDSKLETIEEVDNTLGYDYSKSEPKIVNQVLDIKQNHNEDIENNNISNDVNNNEEGVF